MGARPSLPRWTEIGLSPTLDLSLINLKPCEQSRRWPALAGREETEDGLYGRTCRWSEGLEEGGSQSKRDGDSDRKSSGPGQDWSMKIITPSANELGAAGYLFLFGRMDGFENLIAWPGGPRPPWILNSILRSSPSPSTVSDPVPAHATTEPSLSRTLCHVAHPLLSSSTTITNQTTTRCRESTWPDINTIDPIIASPMPWGIPIFCIRNSSNPHSFFSHPVLNWTTSHLSLSFCPLPCRLWRTPYVPFLTFYPWIRVCVPPSVNNDRDETTRRYIRRYRTRLEKSRETYPRARTGPAQPTMPPQTRVRSRSSVEHIFDLVEGLDEDQLHDLLDELNSTTDTNVPVSKGVEYFEEQRRARAQQQKVLRATPSFLNSPHEPVDWPRQKPRPVSGSQWRQSMRVVSTPYGSLGRHQTEPISPPLTASPPSSPPLSPPGHDSPLSPRRTVTTPILPTERSARQGGEEIQSLPLQERPASPPRQLHDDGGEQERESRPSLHEFGGFTFGFDGAAASSESETQQQQHQQQQPEKEVRPVSPLTPSQPAPQRADFSRISTMPLPSLATADSVHDLPRPRTSTGDAATTANSFKPRAFRRISRPQFLSPVNIPTPDALAERLSEYFFDGPSSPPPTTGFSSFAAPAKRPSAELSMEQMLKEPAAPPSRLVLGQVEKEVPSVGIFEVLTEG